MLVRMGSNALSYPGKGTQIFLKGQLSSETHTHARMHARTHAHTHARMHTHTQQTKKHGLT